MAIFVSYLEKKKTSRNLFMTLYFSNMQQINKKWRISSDFRNSFNAPVWVGLCLPNFKFHLGEDIWAVFLFSFFFLKISFGIMVTSCGSCSFCANLLLSACNLVVWKVLVLWWCFFLTSSVHCSNHIDRHASLALSLFWRGRLDWLSTRASWIYIQQYKRHSWDNNAVQTQWVQEAVFSFSHRYKSESVQTSSCFLDFYLG